MRMIGVHSGETEQLNKLKEEWVAMMEEPDIPWTYENLLEEKGKISVNDVVAKFRIIPRFQYVVNYLMIYFQYVLEGEARKAFFQYLDQGKSVHSELFDQVWKHLLDMLGKRFKENRMPKSRCGAEYLENLILDFNEIGLRELALGLHMAADDVKIFMCQVLKRSGFNFYDKNEFLLYLVLKYAGTNPYYQCYEKLKKDYRKISGKRKDNTIPEYFELFSLDADDPEDEADVESRTRRIAENADIFLKKMKITGIYEDNDMTQLNPVIGKLLGWHATITHDTRTAEEEFHRLYFRAKECYAEEIKNYRGVVEKSAGRLKGEAEVWIYYDPDREITLEEGTVFYSRKLIRKPEFKDEKVDFYLPEKVILKPRTHTSVMISVVPVNKAGEGSAKRKLLPAAVSLQLEEGQVEGQAEGQNENPVRSIQTVSGVRRYASDNEKPGIIQAECSFGCRIPAKTRFVCEDMGETIVLESCEEVTAESFAMEKVKVACHNPKGVGFKRNKDDNYTVIAESRSICNMEKMPDGIREVYNPKPVRYQEIEKEENSVITIQVTGRIGKGRSQEVHVPAVREKFRIVTAIPGVVQAVAAGAFTKKGSLLEGKLKVECPVGTVIPSGTGFVCEKDGDKIVFCSMEDEINISDSLFQRYFYASDNQTGYEDVVDASLFQNWFEKTRIDNNLLHNFSENGNEKERNCLMTLQFLIYEAEMESVYEDAMMRRGRIYRGFDDKDSFADFQEEMDRILLRCNMQTFYMGNPYDCLLAFLFLSADSSVNILRTLWSVTGGKEV